MPLPPRSVARRSGEAVEAVARCEGDGVLCRSLQIKKATFLRAETLGLLLLLLAKRCVDREMRHVALQESKSQEHTPRAGETPSKAGENIWQPPKRSLSL